MEDINKKGEDTKKTYTEEEVVAILDEQERRFAKSIDTDAKIKFRASMLFDIIKNSEKFDEELVNKASNELKMFLYPNDKENQNGVTR